MASKSYQPWKIRHFGLCVYNTCVPWWTVTEVLSVGKVGAECSMVAGVGVAGVKMLTHCTKISFGTDAGVFSTFLTVNTKQEQKRVTQLYGVIWPNPIIIHTIWDYNTMTL